jgi:putative transposase
VLLEVRLAARRADAADVIAAAVEAKTVLGRGRRKTALFHYELIRAAADPAVTTRQRGPMVRDLAALVHPGPFGGTMTVSKDTIDRWIRAWRRGGFDSLKPRGHAQGAVTPAQILALAATLKRERPARTSAQVRRIMMDTLGDAPSESTLLRHFRTLELPTGVRGDVRPVGLR